MFTKQIEKFIKEHPVFYTEDIQDSIGILREQRAIFNTELSRFEKKGHIKRLSRGIYVVPIQSCFGTILPNESTIAKKIYLENNNGFITGPTFLNHIGLSTFLPQKNYIKTNRYNYKSNLSFYVIEAPRIKIYAENLKYIQLLDGIEDTEKYAIDCKQPDRLLYQYIVNNKLDTTKLSILAYKYYKKDTLKKYMKIMEEFYETTL